MKALGLVVLDKKILENCILKTYILNPWPTYATNQNLCNNFGRGPPRDHSCWVWSKSHMRFKRRSWRTFPYIIQNVKLWPLGRGQFWPRGIIWTFFCREHLDNALYQIFWTGERESPHEAQSARENSSLGFIEAVHQYLFFDPVTYLCNQLGRFEQLW